MAELSIAEIFRREGARLARFIRGRIPNAADAEDIAAEVFAELVESERLMRPIEQVGAWLFRVARNRIADRFRRAAVRGIESDAEPASESEDDEGPDLLDLLPAEDAGPEAAYARRILIAELEAALDELPAAQREVFVAHELDGEPFAAIAARTGANLNTLLSRKRQAVLFLRRRLQAIHDDFVQS